MAPAVPLSDFSTRLFDVGAELWSDAATFVDAFVVGLAADLCDVNADVALPPVDDFESEVDDDDVEEDPADDADPADRPPVGVAFVELRTTC
jgi:hypothetical protein